MSKTSESTVEEKQATKTVQTVKAAPKFTVERLAKDCRQLFGVSSCAYAGATDGLTGEYTVAEMRQHIETWMKKEVE